MRKMLGDLALAVCVYVAARYLLGVSTPDRDYRQIMASGLFDDLHWYRGPEYLHQLRGLALLSLYPDADIEEGDA